MSGHSDFIAVTRQMGQITGLSPNQLRTSLRDFARRELERQSTPLPRLPSSAFNLPARSEIGPGRIDLPARPLPVPDPIPAGRRPDEGSSSGTLLNDLIVVMSGTAYYTNVYTDGRLDPV